MRWYDDENMGDWEGSTSNNRRRNHGMLHSVWHHAGKGDEELLWWRGAGKGKEMLGRFLHIWVYFCAAFVLLLHTRRQTWVFNRCEVIDWWDGIEEILSVMRWRNIFLVVWNFWRKTCLGGDKKSCKIYLLLAFYSEIFWFGIYLLFFLKNKFKNK